MDFLGIHWKNDSLIIIICSFKVLFYFQSKLFFSSIWTGDLIAMGFVQWTAWICGGDNECGKYREGPDSGWDRVRDFSSEVPVCCFQTL